MTQFTETIAAPATPAGTSALAVVRVSGPDTRRLVAEIFGEPPPPRAVTRRDYCDRAGVLVDDVLCTFFAGPNSFTGEDTLEISCHGNPYIAQRILEDLIARGCRAAEPGEFTKRAFLNGRMDLSQAEAVMDLIHARSERALAAANRQLRGSLGQRMGRLVEQLTEILARVEAYIDFPEEDLPPEDRSVLIAAVENLSSETKRLLATSHYGELLRDGIKTVIVGAPNVGKSSLLNRLLGRERALVSPEPGTTRDFIEECVIIGPHCLRLIDTAGLNPSPEKLEKLGIELTYERLAEADLVLLVLDASAVVQEMPQALKENLRAGNTVIILNKIDLLDGEATAMVQSGLTSVPVSALTGDGFDELGKVITAMADKYQNDVGEDMVAINARHAQALTRAREALTRTLAQFSDNALTTELVASELREVMDAYGEISGRIDHEQVLDKLFASFCIGK